MAVNGFRDVPELLTYLEKRGLVRRIGVPVNPEYEIAEITRRAARLENGGPVLLFENVAQFGFPVLTNLLGSTQRLAWGLSLNHLGELDQQMLNLLQPAAPLDLTARLARLGETAYLSRYAPRQVRNAPCQEVVLPGTTGLAKLTMLKVSPTDSGTALRSVLVCQRPQGSETTSITSGHLIQTSGGLFLSCAAPVPVSDQPQPVVLVVGADPALLFATQAPLLPALDPLLLACALSHRRVEMVRSKTSDIELPATAEIVLEGVLEPASELVDLNLTVTASQPARLTNLSRFRLTTLTHRKNALLYCPLPGSAENSAMLKAAERLLLPLLRQTLPEISAISFPVEGGVYELAVIAIHKRYAGQAQRVMYALWGMEQFRWLKNILVVDADFDLRQPAGWLAQAFRQFDPARDWLVIKGPLEGDQVGSKLGLDATRKLPGEGNAEPSPADQPQNLTAIRELVGKRWLDYGIE